jgi:hypothetical protein
MLFSITPINNTGNVVIHNTVQRFTKAFFTFKMSKWFHVTCANVISFMPKRK